MLLGNKNVLEAVKQSKKKGALGATTLITAPDGCGRWLFARILAAEYLYDDEIEKNKVISELSSEITVITGEGVTGEIKTESVRNMRASAYETALVGRGRVVIVRDAHRLNKNSANALLKILEEPPPDMLFILTAKSPDDLLPTIRSRCKILRLSPLSESETAEYMSRFKLSKDDEQLLFSAFCGRAGLIKSCALSKKNIEPLRRAHRAAEALENGDRYTFLKEMTGKGKDDRSDYQRLFLCLTHIFTANAKREFNINHEDVSAYYASATVIGQAESALMSNINQKLMITWLCDKIFEEFNGKRNYGGI